MPYTSGLYLILTKRYVQLSHLTASSTFVTVPSDICKTQQVFDVFLVALIIFEDISISSQCNSYINIQTFQYLHSVIVISMQTFQYLQTVIHIVISMYRSTFQGHMNMCKIYTILIHVFIQCLLSQVITVILSAPDALYG